MGGGRLAPVPSSGPFQRFKWAESALVETGNFDDFANIPFGREVNLKMKWPVLPPIPGAEQVHTVKSKS